MWIEIHQSLPRHRKILALATELKVDRVQAIGHLVCFWLWALDNTPDGDLGGISSAMIAFGAEWTDNPQIFVDGLQKSGFIDIEDPDDSVAPVLFIHDWHDYAGRLIESRQHQASQKRLHRELYNDKLLLAEVKQRDGDYCRYCHTKVSWADRKGRSGATYDFVVPSGVLNASNVVVACRACNAGKSNRTPEQAGYTLLAPYLQKSIDTDRYKSATVPNLTVPNLTNTYIHTLRAIPGWVEKGEPHLDALLKWVKSKGIADDVMERAAIGLSSVQKKTLNGYSNLASALQRRINSGFDDPNHKEERGNGTGARGRSTTSKHGGAGEMDWDAYDDELKRERERT